MATSKWFYTRLCYGVDVPVARPEGVRLRHRLPDHVWITEALFARNPRAKEEAEGDFARGESIDAVRRRLVAAGAYGEDADGVPCVRCVE